MSILDILEELAGNSSRLAKEAILEREKFNPNLQTTFKLALDPTLNFYIKKIPEYKPQAYGNTFELAINGLNAPPYRDWETDRKSTRLNSSHRSLSRMPSSA